MKRLKLSNIFVVAKINSRQKSALLLLAITLFYLISPFTAQNADAAALSQAMLRFNRLQTSITDVGIVVMLEVQGASNEDFVDIDFGSGIIVDGTPANITTNVTGLPTGCTSLDVGAAATNVTGQSVEFTISSPADPTTGTLYCFNISAGIDTPGSTGSRVSTIRTEDSGNVLIEESDVDNNFITSDQVTVSAVVPPTFTFTLGATSTSFTSDLSTSTQRSTTGVTGTVVTNAGNGWTAYLRSTNAALNSTVTGDTIATTGTIDNSPTTLSTGAENYNLDVDETADTQTNGSIDAEYDGGAAQGGTFNSSALEPIASGTGATSNYVFTMVGKANISGLTQAANDYTDTWTVVAAGNF